MSVIGNVKSDNPELSKINYELNVQKRYGDDSRRDFQTLYRIGIGYDITQKSSFWLGYDRLNTRNIFSGDNVNTNTPWQQWLYRDTSQYFSFTARTRLEERLVEGSSIFNWRIRQLFGIRAPIKHIPSLSLLISDEIFFDYDGIKRLNKPENFENRLFAGFSYEIRQHIFAQAGYMNQYINDFSQNRFFNNILFIGFVLNFN